MVAAEFQIWRTWGEKYYDLAQLTSEVRRVVGVKQSCSSDPREIARMLKMPFQRVQQVLRAVRRSKHPLVMQMHRRGLPISASVDVPPELELLCKKCRAHIVVVPCIRCGICGGDLPHSMPEESAPMPDEHPYSTQAIPGTSDKIAEMRFRAAMGHRVFHNEDVGTISDDCYHE